MDRETKLKISVIYKTLNGKLPSKAQHGKFSRKIMSLNLDDELEKIKNRKSELPAYLRYAVKFYKLMEDDNGEKDN